MAMFRWMGESDALRVSVKQSNNHSIGWLESAKNLNRQAERHADKESERETGRQGDRRTDRQTEPHSKHKHRAHEFVSVLWTCEREREREWEEKEQQGRVSEYLHM